MRVGRFAGIDVHIHWTFWILILVYLIAAAKPGQMAQGLMAILLVICVFLCILAHEYGHALTARRFGIRTLDITLMPIGGMARLERLPENPIQELFVSLAGPAVNLAIALVLWVVSWFDMRGPSAPILTIAESFLGQLLSVNLLLALFNLLPAFPMDGGRVLRSLLALRVGQLRATSIAARLGRWMALAFAVWGLFIDWNPLLVFLAIFIFIAGTVELLSVKMRHAGRFSSEGFPGPFQRSDERTGGEASQEQTIVDAVGYRQIR